MQPFLKRKKKQVPRTYFTVYSSRARSTLCLTKNTHLSQTPSRPSHSSHPPHSQCSGQRGHASVWRRVNVTPTASATSVEKRTTSTYVHNGHPRGRFPYKFLVTCIRALVIGIPRETSISSRDPLSSERARDGRKDNKVGYKEKGEGRERCRWRDFQLFMHRLKWAGALRIDRAVGRYCCLFFSFLCEEQGTGECWWMRLCF